MQSHEGNHSAASAASAAIMQPECAVVDSDDIWNFNSVIYGVFVPGLVAVGIMGNCLNMLVLNKSALTGVCYFYMRLKVCTDVIGLIFLIPLAIKYLQSSRSWTTFTSAFFFSNVQLYTLNAFFGVGILAMVALTFERFVRIRSSVPISLTHQDQLRRAHWIAVGLFLTSFIVYIPYSFTHKVSDFVDELGQKRYTYCENTSVTSIMIWRVYIWTKQVLFRFGPVVIIAILNIIIWLEYTHIMAKRRTLKGQTAVPDNAFESNEESRLKRMLTSLSLFFLICMTPSAALSGINSEKLQGELGFQVFKAVANLLEICFYSFSFYTLCLTSPQFRVLFKTVIKTVTGNNNAVHPFDDNRNGISKYNGQNEKGQKRHTEFQGKRKIPGTEVFSIEMSSGAHPSTTDSSNYHVYQCNTEERGDKNKRLF